MASCPEKYTPDFITLRFTLQSSRAAFVPPAKQWAANSSNALAAPKGIRPDHGHNQHYGALSSTAPLARLAGGQEGLCYKAQCVIA
jgi:hypothetical protein